MRASAHGVVGGGGHGSITVAGAQSQARSSRHPARQPGDCAAYAGAQGLAGTEVPVGRKPGQDPTALLLGQLVTVLSEGVSLLGKDVPRAQER